MNKKEVDVSPLDAALAEMIKGPLTLWELKQHVDQLVLKFGRERRVTIVDAWPNDEEVA
jgi:hypothetical protein